MFNKKTFFLIGLLLISFISLVYFSEDVEARFLGSSGCKTSSKCNNGDGDCDRNSHCKSGYCKHQAGWDYCRPDPTPPPAPSCTDACSMGQKSCLFNNFVMECTAGANAGCNGWLVTTACPNGCSGGSCISPPEAPCVDNGQRNWGDCNAPEPVCGTTTGSRLAVDNCGNTHGIGCSKSGPACCSDNGQRNWAGCTASNPRCGQTTTGTEYATDNCGGSHSQSCSKTGGACCSPVNGQWSCTGWSTWSSACGVGSRTRSCSCQGVSCGGTCPTKPLERETRDVTCPPPTITTFHEGVRFECKGGNVYDLNSDGRVGFDDYLIFAQRFESQHASIDYTPTKYLSGRNVDMYDFVCFKENGYGKEALMSIQQCLVKSPTSNPDADRDGEVGFDDFLKFIRCTRLGINDNTEGVPCDTFDFDYDETVDTDNDFKCFHQLYGKNIDCSKGCGDLDGDFQVTFEDFIILSRDCFYKTSNLGNCKKIDYNNDNKINAYDFVCFKQDHKKDVSGRASCLVEIGGGCSTDRECGSGNHCTRQGKCCPEGQRYVQDVGCRTPPVINCDACAYKQGPNGEFLAYLRAQGDWVQPILSMYLRISSSCKIRNDDGSLKKAANGRQVYCVYTEEFEPSGRWIQSETLRY
ncbi:MAG: hypothetical protein CMH63_01555 [Nanoarchaeota archaeon]|nr:hypothetical protein [Nanoarchaeota archaeon]